MNEKEKIKRIFQRINNLFVSVEEMEKEGFTSFSDDTEISGEFCPEIKYDEIPLENGMKIVRKIYGQ